MVRKMKKRGGGIFDIIKGILPVAHRIIKDNQLISKGLNAVGLPTVSGIAKTIGYGKTGGKKPARKRKTIRK